MTEDREMGGARFEVRATATDHFAWLRTRLALERTIMAWLRTATALIGFGFVIVQYLNHLAQLPGAHPAYLPEAPRFLGLALIGCGVVALLVAVWQYRWGVRYLWSGPYATIAGAKTGEMQTPVMAVAGILLVIGLFAFFAVLLRVA